MTTATSVPRGARLWLAGARPRTLGAAIAPVLVGTAAAYADASHIDAGRALLASVVAVALQVGVNFANDYSDGVRGADRDRRGPLRLTASGLATPSAVRTAAAVSFGVAAVAGAVLSLLVEPWLLVVGALAIAAAALYTGGPRPYGYHGLGEVAVLAFFGFVATAGSAYVQVERVPAAAWWGALVVGLPACAILLTNNIRDLAGDATAGKRTLAVRVGDRRSRGLYIACVAGAFAAVIPIAVDEPLALLALAAAPLGVAAVRAVMHATAPPQLVGALLATARLQLVLAVLLGAGLCLS
jgi:1,4-dihydroxy-2-naphthoate octaprenyltransferase